MEDTLLKPEKPDQLQAESGSSAPPCSPDYVPFGDEWRKEVMKLTKAQLVEWFRDALIARKACEDELRNIEKASPDLWEMEPDDFKDEFRWWAQNRARHAISKANSSS